MASSSSIPPRKYEVFLSFRGEDTRYTFVSHLYAALEQRGVKTFFDEIDLKKGQSISPELIKSIQDSKFAIIIFSKNYASSTWCLDELVKIMECRSTRNQIVIPIFYDVDPSDVRKQTNSFAESFSRYEMNFKDKMEKVQIWKENLKEAASITGHDLSARNVSESSCIKKIVDDIFSELPRKASTKGLVGMENHLNKLKSLLGEEQNFVCFIGIWGMGGIGKTTTARFIFDELIGEFEGGCFLRDVYKHDIVDLQRNILSKILKAQIYINDEDEGSNIISKRLYFKRVLLVLDDVNDKRQLDLLAGGREWFGNGSRIIVTTRDKHILNDVNKLYEMKSMSDDEAIQLFSWHAFKKSQPNEDFVQLSYGVLSYAGGLPLALEVLGSYLRGRTKDEWRSALKRLKDYPERKIEMCLKISFEGLSGNQQNIFLDIACFFRGHYKEKARGDFDDKVITKLDSFGFHPIDGIEVLQEKSLIHISKGKIEMHDLLQDMGKNMVRQKANENSGKYSRLWDSSDIVDVLTNDTGTEEVEGLVFRHSDDEIELSEGAFRNMKMLRLLEVHHHAKIVISPSHLPNSLRWFYWYNYPGKSLPENFKPRNLVSIELFESSTLQTFPNIRYMPNLKTLSFPGCTELLDVHPSVGVHEKLVVLNLSDCDKIEKIPKHMQMKSLESLSLSGSLGIKNLPKLHRNMSSLRTINIDGMGIKELPWSLGLLTNLQKIYVSNCVCLRAIPKSLCGLQNLESIKLIWCSNLKSFFEKPNDEDEDTQPSSLERKANQLEAYKDDEDVEDYDDDDDDDDDDLEDDEDASKMLTIFLSLPLLRTLTMWRCNVSEMILPDSIGCIKKLDLSESTFVNLPNINHFSCLQDLRLRRCSKLESLPELPPRIKNLCLDDCTALTRIPSLVDLLEKYETLQLLSIARCEHLVQKQDQFDCPQTNALGQSVPQFLLSLFDWGSWKNNIHNRHEAVQVHLPCNDLFNWLPKSIGPQATATLSQTWHNDKLKGFVICAISYIPSFKLVTSDGLLTIIPNPSSFFLDTSEHIAFFYIPIGQVTRGMDMNMNKKNGYCLLEVTNGADFHKDHETGWGISLVYDGKVDMDICDLMVTNDYRENATLKVCVTSHIQI